VAEILKKDKYVIANSFSHPDNNACTERMNRSIQDIKVIVRGLMDMLNERIAIFIHNGKPDLYPIVKFL